MQTLGISNSEVRTESRLKSLFWPSIENAYDVDYLGAQGYWVCTIVGILSAAILLLAGHPILAVFVLSVYYFGGVGVREHSLYAAAFVFFSYVADTFVTFSLVRIFIAAVLLSNFRATWIAARWKPESPDAAMPPRLSATWMDHFVDTVPQTIWPKVRIFFYIISGIYGVLAVVGLAVLGTRYKVR